MRSLKEKLPSTIVLYFLKLEMNSSLIGEKTFYKKDQLNFLKLSLDYNQAHRFNVKKNQFKSKRTIVHGVNILLCAIEYFLNFTEKKIYNVNCSFFRPVFLNEKIKFYFYKDGKNNFIEIENYKKEICVKVFLIFNNSNKIKSNIPQKVINKIMRSKKIINANPMGFLNKKFKILLLKNKKFPIFPKITNIYGNVFCDAICAASYFIGMKCPGEKAIFTNIKFDLDVIRKNLNYLLFDVYRYDNRIRLFSIKVAGLTKMSIQSILTK